MADGDCDDPAAAASPAGGPAEERPVRALVVDDSAFQCAALRALLEKRFGRRVVVEVFTDPRAVLGELSPDVDLLLLDWEMPELDGIALLEEARARGVDLKRVIIRSSHPADELHQNFDRRGCLAVIEKGEPHQQAAFLMILDGIVKRAEARKRR